MKLRNCLFIGFCVSAALISCSKASQDNSGGETSSIDAYSYKNGDVVISECGATFFKGVVVNEKHIKFEDSTTTSVCGDKTITDLGRDVYLYKPVKSIRLGLLKRGDPVRIGDCIDFDFKGITGSATVEDLSDYGTHTYVKLDKEHAPGMGGAAEYFPLSAIQSINDDASKCVASPSPTP